MSVLFCVNIREIEAFLKTGFGLLGTSGQLVACPAAGHLRAFRDYQKLHPDPRIKASFDQMDAEWAAAKGTVQMQPHEWESWRANLRSKAEGEALAVMYSAGWLRLGDSGDGRFGVEGTRVTIERRKPEIEELKIWLQTERGRPMETEYHYYLSRTTPEGALEQLLERLVDKKLDAKAKFPGGERTELLEKAAPYVKDRFVDADKVRQLPALPDYDRIRSLLKTYESFGGNGKGQGR